MQYAIGSRRLYRVDLLVSTDMARQIPTKATHEDSVRLMTATGTSTLRGKVFDGKHNPVAGAAVTLASVETKLRSGDDGSFVFTSLPAGTHVLQVRQVGFAPATMIVDMRPGQTTEADVQMPVARTLETFNVRADYVAGKDQVGFEERRKLGFGYALRKKDFEYRADVGSMLAGLPGMTIRHTNGGVNVTMANGARTCAPTVYLDGVRSDMEVVSIYDIKDFKGVEVYPRQLEVPAQFSTSNPCGAIIFWTRMSKW